MSENVKNETTKVVVVANLKSPVIGFVLALFFCGGLAWIDFIKAEALALCLGLLS